MTTAIWVLAAFISAPFPFRYGSVAWPYKPIFVVTGDRNPGAFNVVRAAGPAWGALATLLDMLKGGIPVGLAWFWWWFERLGAGRDRLGSHFGPRFLPLSLNLKAAKPLP